MMRTTVWVVLAVAVTGCSTPEVALHQANQGVKLTGGLRSELARYQRNSGLAVERRSAALARDNEYVLEVASTVALIDSHRNTAGMTADLNAEKALRDAIGARQQILDDEVKARAALVASAAALGKGTPLPTEKLGAVQMAMGELGTELSVEEKTKIVATFLTGAKKIIDGAAKASEDAAGKTPPAPAPAASAALSPKGG
jgi:hypothetical protein